MSTKRNKRLQELQDMIRQNMRAGRSHSRYIVRLIKENPADKDLILSAERSVYSKMRG